MATGLARDLVLHGRPVVRASRLRWEDRKSDIAIVLYDKAQLRVGEDIQNVVNVFLYIKQAVLRRIELTQQKTKDMMCSTERFLHPLGFLRLAILFRVSVREQIDTEK